MGRNALIKERKELVFYRGICSDRYKAIEYDAKISLIDKLLKTA